MYRSLIAIILGALTFPVLAQMTPVGVWRSIDDKTGQPKAEIRISADAGGVLTGVVEKSLKVVCCDEIYLYVACRWSDPRPRSAS